jgi:hypothetical protein
MQGLVHTNGKPVTDAYPFCSNPDCLCHEEPSRIAKVAAEVVDGLLTPEEATRFVSGKMVGQDGPETVDLAC